MRPDGIKKLVPATRSRISNMQAGSNTANASKEMQEVMNHAQVLSGMRIRVMPLVRRSSVVEMKYSDPSNDAMQKIEIDIAQSVWPVARPGPATPPTALSGA